MSTQIWQWYDMQGLPMDESIVCSEKNGDKKWEWCSEGVPQRVLHVYSELESDLKRAFERDQKGALPCLAAADDAPRPDPGVLLLRVASIDTYEVFYFDESEEVEQIGTMKLEEVRHARKRMRSRMSRHWDSV